jgi:predicted protein tyrosine phosphatase
MASKVIFVGRATAETIGPFHDWAMISIGEPDASNGLPDIKPGWHSIHKTVFHDIDPEHGSPKGIEPSVYQAMTIEDARKIVAFVDNDARLADVIVVHCRAGISRSAAVAKWIARDYGLKFDHKYNKINMHVFRLMDEAGHER